EHVPRVLRGDPRIPVIHTRLVDGPAQVVPIPGVQGLHGWVRLIGGRILCVNRPCRGQQGRRGYRKKTLHGSPPLNATSRRFVLPIQRTPRITVTCAAPGGPPRTRGAPRCLKCKRRACGPAIDAVRERAYTKLFPTVKDRPFSRRAQGRAGM